MARYIDADEFKARLDYCVTKGMGSTIAFTFKHMIDEQPTADVVERKRGEWIPCSERLPEYNVSVLTWDGYAFCIEKRIPFIRDDDGFPIEGDYWVGDEYDDLESDYYTNLRDGAAIAWMPLPKPWKGEKDERFD